MRRRSGRRRFHRMTGLVSALALVVLTATGLGLLHPEWWAKLLVVAGFILFTNPVGSSSIARAAYMAGIKPWRMPGQEENSSKDIP